jgi:DNA-binding MarR family transcriptional regulator
VTKPAPRPFDPIAEARRQWIAHGWEDAADGMAAITSVTRAQQLLQARVDEVLRPFELTFARYELLMLLYFTRHGSIPVTKASVRLQVHPTSVTNLVDRLEAAKLVRRKQHPTDRRGVLVEITASGRRLALKATEQLNAQVFSQPRLSSSRIATLLSVITALRKAEGDFV